MVKIKSENLVKEISSLKNDESIFMPINEDVSNKIQLIDYKIASYNNLFLSYINSTTEEANKMNLQNFINIYSDAFVKKSELMKSELIKNIGIRAYQYVITSKVRYYFNLNINQIVIQKIKEE